MARTYLIVYTYEDEKGNERVYPECVKAKHLNGAIRQLYQCSTHPVKDIMWVR